MCLLEEKYKRGDSILTSNVENRNNGQLYTKAVEPKKQIAKGKLLDNEQTDSVNGKYKVFYLNLDRNQDRADHMEEMLAYLDLVPHRRFRGVDGRKVIASNGSNYLATFEHSAGINFNLEKFQRVNCYL